LPLGVDASILSVGLRLNDWGCHMAERRQLVFASLDEVIPDVERLLAGHTTTGKWSLGQILYHLASALRLTVEGPPSSAEPTREQDISRRRFFRTDRFPEGRQAPAILEPNPSLDARTEADSLREAIDRFVSSTGPFAAHPILGPLSKDEWSRFHCMHFAHHLGFALRAGQAPTG
jgi:hypothetical protein